MNSNETLMWNLLERVLDNAMTKEKAEHILAGTGWMAEFKHWLNEFTKEKQDNEQTY